MKESNVSEELNSVETKELSERVTSYHQVSEELNSVETDNVWAGSEAGAMKFQKNLIVWKLNIPNKRLSPVISVSEELNSVETV